MGGLFILGEGTYYHREHCVGRGVGEDEGGDGVRIKRGGIWNEHMPSVLSEHTNSVSETYDLIVSIVASLLMSNCLTGPTPTPRRRLTWLVVVVVPAAVFWSQDFLWPRCSCEGWAPPPLSVLAPAWHSGGQIPPQG